MELGLPPQQNKELQWLITVSSDLPVGTRVIFSIVFEGSDDNQGNPQTINETLILTITSHRELDFDSTLSQVSDLNPGQRMLFKVNVTSYSSFTEELELNISEGDTWSVKCNNLDQATYSWNLVIPSTNDPSGRNIGWDCEFTTPENTDYVPLELSIISENETLWYTIAELTIIEEANEEGGLIFGLIEFEQDLPLMIGVVGLVFLLFVSLMVIAINKRRKSIDEDDEYEDEEEHVATQQPQVAQPSLVSPQQAAPAVVAPQQVAPAAVMPEQSSITDEQYRAAGWSEDKIADLRRQEGNEVAEVVAVNQAHQNQADYAQQVQYNQPQVTPQQVQPAQVQPEPQAQNEQQNLNLAFGSLGVTEQTDSEDEQSNIPDTASALDTFSPAITDNETESPSQKESEIDDLEKESGQNLPQVNCGFCDRKLTHTDQWVECPDCGIYSHAQCKQGQQVCSRCGSTN
jgi:hypothetical protein